MRLFPFTRGLFMVLVVFLLSGAQLVPAAEPDLPTISTEALKALMDEQKPFVLVDTRTPEEFQEAHIRNAVSIPEKTFETRLSLLPADKSALIVLYCNGVKCGKSRKAAKKAEAAGYRNLVIYAEGFPVWEEKGHAIVAGPEHAKKVETTKISPAELKKLIDGKSADMVIVDVRDESEFKEGHIPTAVNIPVETFALRSEILPKEKKIIVYCNTGGRSYNAYRKLIKLAYPDIAQTLFADWKDAGMPVAR
jgi:rhodanese-related sulfurtransferase